MPRSPHLKNRTRSPGTHPLFSHLLFHSALLHVKFGVGCAVVPTRSQAFWPGQASATRFFGMSGRAAAPAISPVPIEPNACLRGRHATSVLSRKEGCGARGGGGMKEM
eukprot:3248372-Rhodomonas_salina.1